MSDTDVPKYLDNRRLHLIVMPTEKCNFRCTYCYEDFEHGKMSTNVILGIKNLIKKRVNELEILEIGWFGGEPLLNKEAVLELSEYSKEICIANGKIFISSMSTNGYLLTPELANYLEKAGINTFQISIDGDQLSHDRSRVLASGKGTFDTIWRNLLSIKESDLNINIALRIHITKENISSIKIIANIINADFSKDGRFKVYIKPIGNLGGASVKAIHLLDTTETKYLKEEVESYFDKSLIIEEEKSAPSICYAAAGNSLVIRSTGEIGKCTVLLNDRDNSLGRITPDGELLIDNKLFGFWVSGIFREDSATCPVGHVKSLTKPRLNKSQICARP